jgi:hypothetical protein
MDIFWDEKKARRNLAKHKVSFERASRVFDDPHHVTERDPHEGEERWRTLGLVDGVVILMVAHTAKEREHGEEEIRIISARKATRIERDAYHAFRE